MLSCWWCHVGVGVYVLVFMCCRVGGVVLVVLCWWCHVGGVGLTIYISDHGRATQNKIPRNQNVLGFPS